MPISGVTPTRADKVDGALFRLLRIDRSDPAANPRTRHRWQGLSVAYRRALRVEGRRRAIQQIIERARVALDIDGNGDDDATLRRALTEITSTCNYHLDTN
jgi:hypothetical protein